MRNLILLLAVAILSVGVAEAKDKCPHGKKHDCVGPQGEQGPQGENGEKGEKGDPGAAYRPDLNVGVEGVLKVHEGKDMDVDWYYRYSVTNGRGEFAGFRFVFHLGDSYADQQIKLLADRVAELEAAHR